MEKKYKDDEVLSLKKIIIDYALHWRLFLVAGLVSLILALSYSSPGSQIFIVLQFYHCECFERFGIRGSYRVR